MQKESGTVECHLTAFPMPDSFFCVLIFCVLIYCVLTYCVLIIFFVVFFSNSVSRTVSLKTLL